MKIPKIAVLVTAVLAVASAGAFIAAAASHTSNTTTTLVHARGSAAGAAYLGRWLDDPEIQEQLALTPDQVTRLKALRDDSRMSIRELRTAVIRARADLRTTLLDTRAARQDIETKAAAVRDATGAVSKEVTKRLLDARDILTVEQREKLRAAVQERLGAVRGGLRGRRFRGGRRVVPNDVEDGATELF